jgi:hypothetical protein
MSALGHEYFFLEIIHRLLAERETSNFLQENMCAVKMDRAAVVDSFLSW